MDQGPRIAIDAMGGDSGPAAMIAGAVRALRHDPALRFQFFGNERAIKAELAKHQRLAAASTITHTPEEIAATEKPSQAIRRAKTTSMGVAINAVKDGAA